MKTKPGIHSYTSGEIAKARARLAVSADRVDCNPDLIAQMRGELMDLLAKYFDIDDDKLEIRLSFLYVKRGISDVKTIQIK